MKQPMHQDKRKVAKGIGKIATTNQIVDQLQQKLAGYHQRKVTQEQLLNSHDETPMPTKTKNTFKLFNRAQPQTNTTKMQVNQLQDQKESQGVLGYGKASQLLQQVEAIEQLVRKKLALKEERCSRLEQQIQLQKQQKLHLYKINTQLQQQLAKLTKQNKDDQLKLSAEEKDLKLQFERLKKIYEAKRGENKRLKQQQQLVKKTLKQAQNNQKAYHQGEINVIKHKSRSKLTTKKQQNVQQEQYLRNLAGQLDKLRKMVKQKLKSADKR